MASESSQSHSFYLKKDTNHFSNLSSRNTHLINAHIKVDTCHKSMLLSNNLKLNSIIVLGKIKHIYLMVEIKTLEETKLCSVIES
jgi:hypothetical protein